MIDVEAIRTELTVPLQNLELMLHLGAHFCFLRPEFSIESEFSEGRQLFIAFW